MEKLKLVCENITKKYGTKTVLKDINLELESGKIYGLIGRNGAGKTTLLSIIAAQNPSSEGKISINGEEIWENQKMLDLICFSRELNQVTGFGPNNMKVKEYLKTASIYYPNWDKEMADNLVKEFELDVKQKISKLSKGMMSMVTIIVALASKAPFTFLDEPVAGLDVVAREYFYKLLIDEFTTTGRTFVVSTHIIEEAADVLEEVIIIDKGKMILKENTQDLLMRAVHVNGKEEDVDEFCGDRKKHHVETFGRSKGVTLLLDEGEELAENGKVTIQGVSLQNLFVALCGREEE